MYTFSSPSVLASDAAAHPDRARVLRALSDAFRISQEGAYSLARAWHDRDEDASGLAWGMVALLDLNNPTLPQTLRAAGAALQKGAGFDAAALARGRFGNTSQVAALVAAEASVWPDAPIVPIPGAGRVPASAAVAAASVAAYWAGPDLDPEHVEALRAPFEHAGEADLFESGPLTYGPRSASVVELIDRIRAEDVTPQQLSSVTWPSGVWSRAMHEAAWACLREGRLRAQMRAVLDVTLELLLAHSALTPLDARACLPALHAMTVHRLTEDVTDEKALGELSLAEFGI
jgi:hypothetical protein